MIKVWIYRLSSVFALALVMNNSALAAEWAIYRDGFQIPPLTGSDIQPSSVTAASRITPHSLLMRNGDGRLAINNAAYVWRQITEFGFYSGKLSEGLEPKASEVDELLGPAGVFVRVRF